MLRYDLQKKVIVQVLLLMVFVATMLGLVGTKKYSGIIAYQRVAESEWDHLIFKSRTGELDWEWVIEPAYKQARFAGEELLMVENSDGKCGILNMAGQIVIPFQYDAIGDFCDGIAAVRKDGQEFYIVEDGQSLTNTVFQEVFDFAEGKGAVCQDSLWGYIDTSGALVIDCQYDEVGLFREEMAAVSVAGKWGFIDKSGEVIVSPKYDEVQNFQEGMAAVSVAGKWGFIDKSGEVIVSLKYDKVRDFQEGMAAVEREGRWGFIDENGGERVTLEYEYASDFSEGLAAVKRTDAEEREVWAYIDLDNQVVIDFGPYMGTSENPAFPYVGEFHNGIAFFVTKDLFWIIDKDRNSYYMVNSLFFISDFEYNEEYDVIPGYVYVDEAMKERRYGFMGLDGRQRLEPVFDYIYPPHGKYVVVEKLINGEYWCGVIELMLADKQLS